MPFTLDPDAPLFQSTRPVKAATIVLNQCATSIDRFQSTRPVKAATPLPPTGDLSDYVSIHAAREGRDHGCDDMGQGGHVSIHAAREGRDCKPPRQVKRINCFNPRGP